MAIRSLNAALEPGDTLPRNKRGQPMIWVFRPKRVKRKGQWVELEELVKVQLPFTRMTTYIDALDDKAKLHEYGKRMALKGSTFLLDDELDAVRRLDPDDPQDKKTLNGLAEKALKVAGAHRKRDRGTVLHKLSEYVDRGEDLPDFVIVERELVEVTDVDRRDMDLYRCATTYAGLRLGGHIERPVVLDELKIAGTPDRIGWYEGEDPDGETAGHLIVDLKTGRTDFGGLKMAMQLAGYSRSKFYDRDTGEREDLPDDLNQRWGVIINLPPGQGVCVVQWIDLSIGWAGLLLAKEVRAMRNQGRRVFRPFATTGEGSMPNEIDEAEGVDEE